MADYAHRYSCLVQAVRLGRQHSLRRHDLPRCRAPACHRQRQRQTKSCDHSDFRVATPQSRYHWPPTAAPQKSHVHLLQIKTESRFAARGLRLFIVSGAGRPQRAATRRGPQRQEPPRTGLRRWANRRPLPHSFNSWTRHPRIRPSRLRTARITTKTAGHDRSENEAPRRNRKTPKPAPNQETARHSSGTT